MELPQQFTAQMKALLGSEEYRAYEDSFRQERTYGLRVNTGKLSVEEFEKISPFPIRKIPWIHNGFYYDRECAPAKHPYYFAGLYYLQEPSAMTPAELLPVSPGDRVLDLCAAPGGKATELGCRMMGQGLLLANDLSASRAKGLLKNLELFGLPNINVTTEYPQKLAEHFPGYFHKILVDAPCSGEGMFRKDEKLIKSWQKKGPEEYAKIQKSILPAAADMLCEDGLLLYSTCTFSPQEDEEVVAALLKERPEMELVPLPQREGFSPGRPEFGGNLEALHLCVRLYPHKIGGEGHFVALLHKRGRETVSESRKALLPAGQPVKPCRRQEVLAFLQEVAMDIDTDRLGQFSNAVFALSPDFPLVPGMRYIRTGLFLGTLAKDRFEPSQSLAMCLRAGQYAREVSFCADDIRAVKYLKGETIDISDRESPGKGYVLVCVDGYPLGWAKCSGSTLKNKYPAGWRWL